MKCQFIFCHEPAVSRVTVPLHRPGCAFCDEHAGAMLAWALPYRKQPGRVVIEPLAA